MLSQSLDRFRCRQRCVKVTSIHAVLTEIGSHVKSSDNDRITAPNLPVVEEKPEVVHRSAQIYAPALGSETLYDLQKCRVGSYR